ncbi:hypothetical protein [Labedaea rhizosphaerae]|uniref:Excreted virulence factor EspC (Type VII ESX diderm) n=1 Tax=Labedaea rhizosphaerae TaxID=598644 RepID=A0A4R6SR73_LABRH|nr:hypothetical protein [Labedaea rhizosphaerae]TDQ05783.1 hypothetical protein EV186_1011761 [Labedaea rhizosphaerae]
MPDGSAPTAYGKTSMSTEEVGLIANDFRALSEALEDAAKFAKPRIDPASPKEFGGIPETSKTVEDLMAIVGHLVDSLGYASAFVHSMGQSLMQAAGTVDYTDESNAKDLQGKAEGGA